MSYDSPQTIRDATDLVVSSAHKVPIRTAVATPVSVLAADEIVFIDTAAIGAAVAVSLPDPATVVGQKFAIKDIGGLAATHNVTITPAAGTIDGDADLVLDGPYDGFGLVSDGTKYLIAGVA